MYTQIIQVMDDHFSIETHGDLGIHDLRNPHRPRRNPPHWISMDPWIIGLVVEKSPETPIPQRPGTHPEGATANPHLLFQIACNVCVCESLQISAHPPNIW